MVLAKHTTPSVGVGGCGDLDKAIFREKIGSRNKLGLIDHIGLNLGASGVRCDCCLREDISKVGLGFCVLGRYMRVKGRVTLLSFVVSCCSWFEHRS